MGRNKIGLFKKGGNNNSIKRGAFFSLTREEIKLG